MFSFLLSFGFGKRLGFVSINVILRCICVFTLAEKKICLCVWEFSGTFREEMKPCHLGTDVGSGGQNGPNLGVGLFWDGGGF